MATPTHLLLLLTLLVSAILGVAGWGADGHRITCLIAEPLLSSDAKEAIEKLLPGKNFPSFCTWADQVRSSYKYRWTSPLHFIDTPDNLCGYSYARDCHNPQKQKGMCVAGAINNYTSQLETFNDVDSQQYNLTESLLFLSHFVGDIHQPLHVGFTSDLGGNSVYVYWYGKKKNLHHIWDTEFITKAKTLYFHDIYKMSNNISSSISNDEESEWTSCESKQEQSVCTDIYATESIRAACKFAYKDASKNSDLEDSYFYSRLPVVEQRLAQGGVRLAAILNNVFSKPSANK